MAKRAELKALLAQPLVARGISVRYLTSGSKSIADDLINSSSELFFDGFAEHRVGLTSELSDHQNMLGVSTGTARDDVVKTRTKRFHGKRDIAPDA